MIIVSAWWHTLMWAKEDFRDWETYLVAVHGKGDFDLQGNYRRWSEIAKATTDSPRDLFPTAAWPNVNWISPGVVLLVSMARFGKSSQTLLYFSVTVLLVSMTSWIKQSFLFPGLLRWWWRINKDKTLVDIVVDQQILPVSSILKSQQTFVFFPLRRIRKKVIRSKEKFVSLYFGILYLAPEIKNPYLNFILRWCEIPPLALRNEFFLVPTQVYI